MVAYIHGVVGLAMRNAAALQALAMVRLALSSDSPVLLSSPSVVTYITPVTSGAVPCGKPPT